MAYNEICSSNEKKYSTNTCYNTGKHECEKNSLMKSKFGKYID